MRDMIDAAAELAEGSLAHALRRQRPDIVRLSQSSFEAALRPRDTGNLSRADRAALAARMARHFGDERLAAAYADLLADEGPSPEVGALATPGGPPPRDPRLAAIIRHVDRVTLAPEAARPEDISLLKDAGLSDRDIVTLTGLAAFVNYQLRVIAGLRLLEGRT